MNTSLRVLLLFSIASHALAAPLSPPVQAEIDKLMSGLQASGCEFHRNGSWYSAAEARKHLLQKLDYLKDRNMVTSTEQFIELAASTSSMSGKPYLVRCAGGAPVESQKWLTLQLKAIRDTSPTPK